MNKQSTVNQTAPEIRTPIRGKTDAFKRLSSHLQSGEKISLETCCSCQPTLNGYLLGLSRELGLMHCFHEFMPDGYLVFRLSNVTSIRCSDYERFMNRMLAGEGLLDGLKTSLQIDLENITTAITSINTRYATMILETEIPKDGYSDFFIGQIESIDSTRLRFNHFDALGNWDQETTIIPFRMIAFVQFLTPYITTFSKYIEPRKRVKRKNLNKR